MVNEFDSIIFLCIRFIRILPEKNITLLNRNIKIRTDYSVMAVAEDVGLIVRDPGGACAGRFFASSLDTSVSPAHTAIDGVGARTNTNLMCCYRTAWQPCARPGSQRRRHCPHTRPPSPATDCCTRCKNVCARVQMKTGSTNR